MLIHPSTPNLGRYVGQGGAITKRPAFAASCDADVYDEDTPAENTNGTLAVDARHAGLIVDVATAGEEEEAEQRPLAIIAASQWLYTGVRLMGRHVGEATVGEGEEADTREVYAVTTCRQCLWAADYFERADGESGEDWTDVAGTSAIAANKLQTASANAIFRHRRDVPNPGFGQFGNPSGRVTATVFSATVGAEAKLIGGYDDEDNYCYLLWEYADGMGKASIYDRVDGDDTLVSGPWLFPGRGAGVATRLRFCWFLEFVNNRLAAAVFIDDEHEPTGGWFDIRYLNPETLPERGQAFGGHGLGTGNLPSGTVAFDDYRAEIVYDQRQQCPLCHFVECWYQQELCLRVIGVLGPNSDEPIPVDQTHILDGRTRLSVAILPGGGGGPWSKSWDQVFDPSPPIPEGQILNWTAAFEQDEETAEWTLTVTHTITPYSIGTGVRQTWTLSLGTDPPRCDLWNCLTLTEWTGDAIYGACLTISPRTDLYDDCAACYCYAPVPGLDQCCGGGNSMPGVLYMSATLNGSPIVEDMELTNQGEAGNAGGFDFESNPFIPLPAGFAGCTGSVPNGNPDKVTASVQTASNPGGVTINLTVESCDPFYATGTREFPESSGDVYVIEVYA